MNGIAPGTPGHAPHGSCSAWSAGGSEPARSGAREAPRPGRAARRGRPRRAGLARARLALAPRHRAAARGPARAVVGAARLRRRVHDRGCARFLGAAADAGVPVRRGRAAVGLARSGASRICPPPDRRRVGRAAEVRPDDRAQAGLYRPTVRQSDRPAVIGVVIPTLNEASCLPGLLADLQRLRQIVPLDVVVADGGSRDGTLAVAERGAARTLVGPAGRARQLNAGAAAARGEWLLFLQADARVPPAARRALLAAVVDAPVPQVAVFRFAIDLPAPWKRFIELGQARRQRLYHLPYGDQGLLIRRELFHATGGYADIEIMEDVEMIRRMKRRRVEIRALAGALVTSGRRYRERGVLRTWLTNVMLIALYFVGVPPRRLARWRAT